MHLDAPPLGMKRSFSNSRVQHRDVTGISPFDSRSVQHSVSVSNAQTRNKEFSEIQSGNNRRKTQKNHNLKDASCKPETLSLVGSVFPPIRSTFFPQET